MKTSKGLVKETDKISAGSSIAVRIINTTEFSTPLGPMLAGATSEGICLLEFTNRIRLDKELYDLKTLLNAVIVPDQNPFLDQLEIEISEYFQGLRKTFSVPLHIPGNEFAQAVWKILQEIPYGETCSYKEQSLMMNNPKAIRAIASTNGRNRIAIIIPCHRVIGSAGNMTGYAAGIDKKKWLLRFERENSDIVPGTLF